LFHVRIPAIRQLLRWISCQSPTQPSHFASDIHIIAHLKSDVTFCIDTFSYITQFLPSSYTEVIAILIRNNLFLQRNSKFKFSNFPLKLVSWGTSMSKDFEIWSFYHFCLFLDVFCARAGGGLRRKELHLPLVQVGISNQDNRE
jgi:hypothetical protein